LTLIFRATQNPSFKKPNHTSAGLFLRRMASTSPFGKPLAAPMRGCSKSLPRGDLPRGEHAFWACPLPPPGNHAKTRKEKGCGGSILQLLENKGANLQPRGSGE